MEDFSHRRGGDHERSPAFCTCLSKDKKPMQLQQDEVRKRIENDKQGSGIATKRPIQICWRSFRSQIRFPPNIDTNTPVSRLLRGHLQLQVPKTHNHSSFQEYWRRHSSHFHPPAMLRPRKQTWEQAPRSHLPRPPNEVNNGLFQNKIWNSYWHNNVPQSVFRHWFKKLFRRYVQ